MKTEESEHFDQDILNDLRGDSKEREDSIERLRSNSLPNLIFNPESEEYQYEITRDFRAEVVNYL
jgi:hypothetical protein